MYRRKKLGFTLVEIITVMVLISFVCIMTTKVIQHNLEQKVPLYVYNLYKNLENEGKILTNTLQTQEEYKNMPLEDILQSFNATNYCEAFAKDVNLIGNVDCENSVKNVQSGASNRKKVTYSCTRNYEFKVNDNGSYTETLNPTYNSTNDLCSDNTNFTDKKITCNATPTVSIADLMKSNTSSQQTYSCEKTSEEDDEPIQGQLGEVFDLDTKPGLNNELKTTNNIRLNFVALSNGQTQYTGQYDLYANVNQDAICPKLDLSDLQGFNYNNNYIYPKIKFINQTGAKSTEKYLCNVPDNINACNLNNNELYCIFANSGKCTVSPSALNTCNNLTKGVTATTANMTYEPYSQIKITFTDNSQTIIKTFSNTYYNINNTNCSDLLEYIKTLTSVYNNTNAVNYKWWFVKTLFTIKNKNKFVIQAYIRIFKNTALDSWQMLNKYYTKWNTFFANNSSFQKVTKAAINSQGFNEGSVESISTNSNGSQNYLAHFIYAAIDTPFDKGEMNKNIFVFEQFGDKIIPVGFLANNANSPLKFNVITRNPQTFKIEKVNNDALTFCEAMEYTGDKFSQYCGCKDGNNNVVTQFEKNAACNNSFGCKIKPIRPTNLAPKFKLF